MKMIILTAAEQMNGWEALVAIATLCFIAFLAWLVLRRIMKLPLLLALALCGCSKPEPTKPGNWSKWSDPKITSDRWEGTTIWQTRTNIDTGEVELRAQTATYKGGYYE